MKKYLLIILILALIGGIFYIWHVETNARIEESRANLVRENAQKKLCSENKECKDVDCRGAAAGSWVCNKNGFGICDKGHCGCALTCL